MKIHNITKIVGIGAIALAMTGCGGNPQPTKSTNQILKGTKGSRISTISVHRESSMLGAALNMYVFVDGKKVPQKLYSGDTVITKVRHNGTIVLQVENEMKKIKSVKSGEVINCSVSPTFGGEMMKNAFMVNGFEPKMNVELKCNKNK